jgi:hydroxymethylpyrimidine/phosphomethylpyrimidine kinase
MTPRSRPVALTIAGSDSGGGAGLQADLKTFHAFGVFGTTVVTAVTAQNTLAVHDVHPVPVPTVRAQIDAVATDLKPDAFKTGMLGTAAVADCVAEAVRFHGLVNFVLDPVMVATSGDRLLEADAEDAVRRLLPLARLVTPNLDEAAILTGRTVETFDDMSTAARALVSAGAEAALVKGGHLDGDAVDLPWDGHEVRVWRRQRIDTRHTHGTGCTLAAAVTAGLAHGRRLEQAVEDAIDYVARAIASAPGLGAGHGPVDHFVTPA